MHTHIKKNEGLAGVVAGDSAICLCGTSEHGLWYRGYQIDDLVIHASFEETAWLLTRGELPTKQELQTYRTKLHALRDLPLQVKKTLEILPKTASPMDVLRTGVSALGSFEPEKEFSRQLDIADHLISCLSSIILYWWKFHQTQQPPQLSSEENSIAANFLAVLSGKPANDLFSKALNTSLILYAEHEFNASTFVVRTIASTLSDFYSCICGGIGALRGPLHGGANESAMEMIQRFKTEEEAEVGVMHLLGKHQLIMGFGHRVYKTSDPRSEVMKTWAHKLSLHAPDGFLFSIAQRIERVMWEEKRLFPNLDFYSGLVYHYCQIPRSLFTPLFAISRIAGWAAHVLEQRAHNRIIRPVSHYIGPEPKQWHPLEQR